MLTMKGEGMYEAGSPSFCSHTPSPSAKPTVSSSSAFTSLSASFSNPACSRRGVSGRYRRAWFIDGMRAVLIISARGWTPVGTYPVNHPRCIFVVIVVA